MQNQQPSTLKEIRVHGTQDFPCAFYQTGTRIKGNMVKHHWHEEVELLYFFGVEVLSGSKIWNVSTFQRNVFDFINPGNCTVFMLKKTAAVWKMRWFFIWIC